MNRIWLELVPGSAPDLEIVYSAILVDSGRR